MLGLLSITHWFYFHQSGESNHGTMRFASVFGCRPAGLVDNAQKQDKALVCFANP